MKSFNSDYINDEFFIFGINNNFELKIFNRWGSLIFSEYPYTNSWMGVDVKGNEISEGQYFYVLKNYEEDIEINGVVTIVK